MSAEPPQKGLCESLKGRLVPFQTKETTHNTHYYMKKSLITMMAAAMMSTAFAGEATTEAITLTAPQDFKRLSGALHVGAATAYTCQGYVPTT